MGNFDKKLVIFAGTNGVGKSTLYNVLSEYRNMPRINTDEIARDFGNSENKSVLLKAGKVAIKQQRYYIENDISFNQETTLCGHSILRTLTEAKRKGYEIEVHYIGVESVEICKQRIKKRVLRGGHNIPDSDVERRYTKSFLNMQNIFSACDKIVFYDNTQELKLVALYDNGKTAYLTLEIPDWFSFYFNKFFIDF